MKDIEILYNRYDGIFHKYIKIGEKMWFDEKSAFVFDEDEHIMLGKTSKDMLELIEENDLVNGYRILKIDEIHNRKAKAFLVYKHGDQEFLKIWANEDIKEIITHEQIEKDSFKII